jgi:hypothetical protein
MPETEIPKRYNRDEDLKPGSPPRSATEPAGSDGSRRSSKTMTDPASGEPQPGPPAPSRSDVDETDGAR